MLTDHCYAVKVEWTGNLSTGTSGYAEYSRHHEITVEGKPLIPGSSDLAFRGDTERYNPEDLLVSALSACHMLWYLHLCADAGIVVTEYVDCAEGVMVEEIDGGGKFQRVVLHPTVTVVEGTNISKARELHSQANSKCFIANSVNFTVEHETIIKVKSS